MIGQFHGKLAEEWGLIDKPVTELRMKRLANGQHPETGEQLVSHRSHATEQPWQKTNTAWASHLEKSFGDAMAAGRDPFADGARESPKSKALPVPGEGLLLTERSAEDSILIELQEEAAKFYSDRLAADAGKRGRDYLVGRGITEESVDKFRLGVSGAHNELLNHFREKFGSDGRMTKAVLVESGLFYEDGAGELQDRFRNRLMVPIQDAHGAVVAFAGRRMGGGEKNKYINSKNSLIYVKGETVYNLHRAAAVGSGRIVGVEGYLDVIQADQAGVKDVIALGGVSLSGAKASAAVKAAAKFEPFRANPGDFDAGRVPILQLWRDLGGADLQGRRGKAFWHETKGYNVAIDPDKNLWHDKGADEGGGTVRLAAVALGVDDKEAWRWLKERYGDGIINSVPAPKATEVPKPNGLSAVEQIKRVAHTLVLNLDGDKAGREATEKHIPGLLESGLRVRAISLEGDPDEFALKYGAEAYKSALDRAKPLVFWLADRAKEKYDVTTAEGKADAVRWVTENLAHTIAANREEVKAEVAKYLGSKVEEKEKSKHAERRAGVDIVNSPPKSFSLQGLVAGKLEDGTIVPGDARILEWHVKANLAADDAMQEYVQARLRDIGAATSEEWCAAIFLHTTARPVGDHSPNPHIHSHNFVPNLTRLAERFASMDPNWLYRVQSYGNAVYLSEMANMAREGGYQLVRGKNFSMEIKGFPKEYLAAMSLRGDEIETEKEARGMTGAAASEAIGYELRQAKQKWEPAELAEQHRKEAETFGVNTAFLQQGARERGGYYISAEAKHKLANEALDYAKERLFASQAVNPYHEIVRDALRYRPDLLRRKDILEAFAERREEFIRVAHYRQNAPKAHYTTPEMKGIERESIQIVLRGRGAVEPIVSPDVMSKWDFAAKYKVRTTPNGKVYEMTKPQMAMTYAAITSTDQYQIVAGVAGAGKSTSVEVIAEIAQQHRDAGFKVVGMAATSSATNTLKDIGIPAQTIQRHITRGVEPGTAKTLYILDEGSLIGAQSFRKFLDTVRPQDRVIIAYDKRQHHSVEAGRIIYEMELAGIPAIRLEDIMRQKDNPELAAVISKFRDSFGPRGSKNMSEGLEMLKAQGRIHEAPHRAKRFGQIAEYYSQDPDRTLIVTPDNRSIAEINKAVREKLQELGYIKEDIHEAVILKAARSLKAPDLKLAVNYEEGNVIRWGRGGTLGGKGRVSAGQYTTVVGVDADANTVTIRVGDSLGVRDITYDPRNGSSAEIYESGVQQLAVGDKIRITRNWTLKPGDVIANNELGKIVSLDADGKGEIEFNFGRENARIVKWDARQMPHISLGYSMTSYSAQSVTVPRVAVHLDTGDSRIAKLIEKPLLYVGASRGAEDVAVFTDDTDFLLSKESPILKQFEKPMALSEEEIEEVSVGVKVA